MNSDVFVCARSDSSWEFERGVDPAHASLHDCSFGAHRTIITTELVRELVGMRNLLRAAHRLCFDADRSDKLIFSRPVRFIDSQTVVLRSIVKLSATKQRNK